MFHKLTTLIDMVRTYKNWLQAVLYRLDYRPGEMILELRNGPKFWVRNRNEQSADAYVVNESFLYGIHDEMLPYMKKAKVGLDIGAHIGPFTVFAPKPPPAMIYAVEPDDDNRSYL